MTFNARILIVTCLVFLGTAVCLSGPATAQIYKWTDETGKTHYTNDKSKIPRQYRNPERLQQMRGSTPGSSTFGGGGGNASGGAPSGGGPSKGEDDKGILSDSDEALVKDLQAFLKKETEFAKEQETATMNPTGQRGFINAFQGLNSERQAVLGRVKDSKVPEFKEVASHIQSGLNAATANPVGIRKMAVADTLKRVKSETSGNESLIQKLEKAVEKSKELKKEKEKKKKAEAEKMKEVPETPAPQ